MKCPSCGAEITLKIGTKIESKNCNVLTNLTSIVTVQCEKCKHVFQVPVESKTVFSLKKDEE
jgi:hypothetical protein